MHCHECRKALCSVDFSACIKIVVAVGTTVLVLLQFVFMVWEIVLVISAWGYLCIEFF